MGKGDFVDYVVRDLLSDLEGVRSRRMFGGYGIFRDDLMFGIVDDDQLYFKVDETNRPQYADLDCRPFTYTARGKSIALSYWEVPANILDDREEACLWAKASCSIAQKLARKKRR